MNRAGRFLFMGFLVPDADIGRIFVGEEHPQFSAIRFQGSLLTALERAGASIDAVTTPPIATFPRNHNWWVSGRRYELAGLRTRGWQISGPNLPGMRNLVRLIQVVRYGRRVLRLPCEGILVYSVHTPLVLAALFLKRLTRVPVFVIIPDLPTFMGGPSHPVKRLMKRVDSAVVRRLLLLTDGAFPITERIGLDWLAGGPPFFAIEGVSDESATALSGARSNGSFVFRGPHQPRLLYTGMLSQVLGFAHAFHRSSVDASLVFMGGGEESSQLQKLADLDGRITIKPFTTGQGFAQEVQRADFLLNPRDPSWPGARYSFPSKFFEYLSTGKPIVSTRLPGVPDAYFTLFRPVDMVDQQAFESSLERAIQVDEDPEGIWQAAELLGQRLTSDVVGRQILRRICEWTRTQTE